MFYQCNYGHLTTWLSFSKLLYLHWGPEMCYLICGMLWYVVLVQVWGTLHSLVRAVVGVGGDPFWNICSGLLQYRYVNFTVKPLIFLIQ